MGRPRKEGLDYFPMDADMLSDYKIRKLIRRMGIAAVSVYIWLLSEIYRGRGYYMDWTDNALLSASEKTGCTEEYIDDVIGCCVAEGLFSAQVYAQSGVLTSAGIQRRYLSAIRERIRQLKLHGRAMELKSAVWVLPAQETRELLLEMDASDGQETTAVQEGEEYIPYKVHKVKESKKEERKQEKRRGKEENAPWEAAPAPGEPAPSAAPTQDGLEISLTEEERAALDAQYGRQAVEAKLMHLKDWAAQRGTAVKSPALKLQAWLCEDARREQQHSNAPPAFKKTGAHAYQQRQYSEEELDAMLFTDPEHLLD